jgi:hypothetical protein
MELEQSTLFLLSLMRLDSDHRASPVRLFQHTRLSFACSQTAQPTTLPRVRVFTAPKVPRRLSVAIPEPLAPQDDEWRRFESAHYVQCPHLINGKSCGKMLGNVMKNFVIFIRAVVADQDRSVSGFLISKCPRCNHSLEWRLEAAPSATS